MDSAALTVTPLTTVIGAEIDGVDIASDFDNKALTRIRAALIEHQVIFFRDQKLSLEDLENFSARFGPLLRVPYVEPVDGHPNVIAVLKQAEETRISVFGGEWHSDFSYLEAPPGLTVLYAMDVPLGRGDTLWTSMYAAYEGLSDGFRRKLDRMRVMHSGHVYGAKRPRSARMRTSQSMNISRGNAEADIERPHPAVRLHPESGRPALFVNPIYTTRFEGMEEAESRPLLDALYAEATRPEYTCRFEWRNGSVAVWDNRCTMHLAINDYDGHRRLLYRTTVGGERPRGPPRNN
ncbi:MAG TPA: TauD/TfdA family dioxygenase [Gammaproteobacteria bacterium]|nr:TauD/TfdA family dioxygenase [Gammaproteobacteria bacterium]